MKWELVYHKGLRTDYIALCLFGKEEGGAILWSQDWGHKYHTPDGFMDRDLIIHYKTWDKIHCDCYIQNEKEILEEARKLLVKEML